MPIEKPAIERLFQAAVAESNNLQSSLACTGTVALPNNFDIHDLEQYQPGRRRFRGKLLTASLADFVAFTKARAEEGLQCPGFIDADALSAQAVFNLGNAQAPGHGDYTATLKLKATAAFAAALKADGQRFTQRDLVDFIVDWKDVLTPYDAGAEPGAVNYAPLTRAIEAIRVVTITSKSEAETNVGDFKATTSTFDEIEAKSRLGLPSGFVFNGEPYLGLPRVSFLLRLAVLPGDGKTPPALQLRIVQKEALLEGIAKDFKEVLIRELDGVSTLTIGTFSL